MKISEKLAIVKRKESELMRTYELRDSIAKQSFKESALLSGKETTKELEKRQKEFLSIKESKVEEYNKNIELLKKEIIEGKNKVNSKNLEIGIDKKLAEMKYLRIELSKLMSLIKRDSYLSSLNIEVS